MGINKSKIEEAAYELLGEMRESTEEERKALNNCYEKLYEPTGLNFYDLINKDKENGSD